MGGPSPSPNPRRGKLEIQQDDFETMSQLFNYDTDDFDTVYGDSNGNFSPQTKSHKSKNNEKKDKTATARSKKDKAPKRPMRITTRESMSSEEYNADVKNETTFSKR